jgi:hypothetical protein
MEPNDGHRSRGYLHVHQLRNRLGKGERVTRLRFTRSFSKWNETRRERFSIRGESLRHHLHIWGFWSQRGAVHRLVALDFNPDYLALCSRRYATCFAQFEPVLHDLSQGPPVITPVECIFAGLVLEYLCVASFCGYLASHLTIGGSFAALLQLPSPTLPEVSPSPFDSLSRLEPAFSFIHPESLNESLVAHGFSRIASDRYDLDSGKSFYYASYQVTNAA